MGITDLLSSFFTFPELHAESPPDNDKDSKDKGEEKEEGGDDKEGKEEGGEDKEGEEKEGGEEEGEEKEEGGEEEPEEEEEEEDEPVDPKPKLEADCARSAQCAPAKHHFDDCVERVTAQHENPNHKGHKEDCVEECTYHRASPRQPPTLRPA
ncbi:MAG: hypothetical protein MMC33_004219 [Icmadophila ericetorum]|nr:hypothetical protein [Icmadophila ericetorum]